MDPLRCAIACVPLAAYLLLLGVVNLRRRPLITSGSADLAALGVALTGFVFVGPIELFRPQDLTGELGNGVWLFWVVFYWTSVALAVLVIRPRLVVYNASLEQLRPVVAEAAGQVDPDARWAGDSLVLPRLGVQAHLESFGLMRNTSLVATGSVQDLDGWRKLRRVLQRTADGLTVAPNPRSVSFLLVGSAMMAFSVGYLVSDPVDVAKAVTEVFAF
ncbi:MAG: hypothetical protein AAGJ46_01915 [Planctomycetota bacterium]